MERFTVSLRSYYGDKREKGKECKHKIAKNLWLLSMRSVLSLYTRKVR